MADLYLCLDTSVGYVTYIHANTFCVPSLSLSVSVFLHNLETRGPGAVEQFRHCVGLGAAVLDWAKVSLCSALLASCQLLPVEGCQ